MAEATIEQEATEQQEHVLHIPDSEEGDLRYSWDPANEAQVELVREAFESARGRGMSAFRTRPGGEPGEQIREFDPSAESIVMMPQMVGG